MGVEAGLCKFPLTLVSGEEDPLGRSVTPEVAL